MPLKVSVIVPVYNCEAYLRRCLDSILAQEGVPFELIAINDGSTDTSLSILQEYAKQYSQQFVLIDQQNRGQGAARNRGLERAKGEYVLFIDSDDFIEPSTLQKTVKIADRDESDIVHFGWKLIRLGQTEASGYQYPASEPFGTLAGLSSNECDKLLRVENFYSVTNLLRRSFLSQHSIRFDEGHIYEDNTFVVWIANRARRISFLHEPLYVVQEHVRSTTRSHIDTDKHVKDHIRAVSQSFKLLEPRTPHTTFYLAAHFVEKFFVYYERRVPRKYRQEYVRQFVDILHEKEINPPPDGTSNRMLRLCLRWGIFERKHYRAFHLIVLLKIHVLPRVAYIRGLLRGAQK